MNEFEKAIEAQKVMLETARRTYEEQVAASEAMMDRLLAQLEKQSPSTPKVGPQSAWIDKEDGARFLLLNEEAANHVTELFSKFKEVLDLMAGQQS